MQKKIELFNDILYFKNSELSCLTCNIKLIVVVNTLTNSLSNTLNRMTQL